MSQDDQRDGPTPAADAERDAWLREALRHAPDAAAAPPAALRESILAQARAATAASSAPSPAALRPVASRSVPGSSFAAFWSWLARPPVASGFAGLMAATLVGLMWWDQPMDLARPRPAAPAAERVEPAPAAAPAPEMPSPTVAPPAPAPVRDAPVTAAAPREARKEADATSRLAARNDAPQAFPSAESKATADASRADEDRAAKQAAGAAAPPPVAPAPPAEAKSEMRSPAPRPSSIAAPPPVPPGDRQRMAGAGEASRDAEANALAGAPRAGMEEAAKPRDGSLGDRGEIAGRTQMPARRDSARPVAALLASLAAEPSRWSRRLAGGASAPLDAATLRWFDDVDAATRGGWAAATSAAGASLEAAAPSRAGPSVPDPGRPNASLVLLLDGRPAAVVDLSGSTVLLESSLDGTTRRWRAPLSEAEASRLASTLPR